MSDERERRLALAEMAPAGQRLDRHAELLRTATQEAERVDRERRALVGLRSRIQALADTIEAEGDRATADRVRALSVVSTADLQRVPVVTEALLRAIR